MQALDTDLILEVTLSTLIADGAIKRVVDLHTQTLQVQTQRLSETLKSKRAWHLNDTARSTHRHTSKNSMTPSLAFFTSGVSVFIFMPGPAGIAHDATGLGLFSTCSKMQLSYSSFLGLSCALVKATDLKSKTPSGGHTALAD